MKNYYVFSFSLFLLSLLFFNTLSATSLPYWEECPLIDHLTEVNKEWLKAEIKDDRYWRPVRFRHDDQRIQTHLQLVESTLRLREVPGLATKQQEKRDHQLDVLKIYWQEGKFPRNTRHPVRQPYFIDDFGTACAVGYLALQSGEAALVDKINHEDNYAYVREMDYPELLNWGSDNGLSLDELAWIQPGYPPAIRTFNGVGNGGGVLGKVNAMVANMNEDMLYMAGQFSEVDGVEASNIIAWDGVEWHTLGEGLIGEIFALESAPEGIYVGGDFYLSGQPDKKNIALWNGSEWIGLQAGDMGGSIYTLKIRYQELYVGGDFQQVNGTSMPFLAKYQTLQENWTNAVQRYIPGMGTVEVSKAISVNGTVKCLELVDDHLLVGGAFTLTAPEADPDLISVLDAQYLAYWDGADWVNALYGDHPPVEVVRYIDGDLYIGTTVADEFGFSIFRAGLWLHHPYLLQPLGDNLVHDFKKIDGDIYMIGGFRFTPGIGTLGDGAAIAEGGQYFEGYAYFDETVNTVIKFKDKIYFAGSFDQINGQSYKGLTQVSMITSGVPPVPTIDMTVYIDGDNLHLDYQFLDKEARFELYDMRGQKLLDSRLDGGTDSKLIPVNFLPAGTYVYQLINEEIRQGDKFVKPR